MTWLDPILRQIARLSVRQGWLFPLVEQRLRAAFVQAAMAENAGAVTDSKISIVTGLQRRDVARLRAETAPAPAPAHRQPLAEIIALWWDDPRFDPEGIPMQGSGGDFATLARSVRKDVHPRTFLDILIETGAVEADGDMVRLKSRSYCPAAGSEDQLAYLSDNIADHLSVAVRNVVDDAKEFELAVHYKGLSREAIKELKAHHRKGMTQLLAELDAMARAMPKTHSGDHRFRAGGYFFDDLDKKEITE